jgi:uncharacterized RDD family membrane protein YckC
LASNSSSSPEYAGFWQRFAAFVIDWLIVSVISVPIIVLVFGAQYFSLEPATHAWDLVATLVVGAAAVAFWRYCGATPGKIAMDIKIVDAKTGGRPGTARLVVRFLCYFLSALPLYLGFIWIAIDRRKQGWHDKIAGTVVIEEFD